MVVVVDMCTAYVDTGMLCGCIVVYGMYMAVYGNVSNVCCPIIPCSFNPLRTWNTNQSRGILRNTISCLHLVES
jgi:hypothetical protein